MSYLKFVHHFFSMNVFVHYNSQNVASLCYNSRYVDCNIVSFTQKQIFIKENINAQNELHLVYQYQLKLWMSNVKRFRLTRN